PLLRIGHDRFLPGLRELVRVVREASEGRTRLFIQVIDFLTIRRRPDPARYFAQFLAITARHRAARAELVKVLEPRELESLDAGYRERVTDTHLPALRDLPDQLPGLFADAACRA